MINEDPILDIISIFNKNYKDREDKAALFLIGDGELGKVVADIKGDPRVLAQSFGNMMQTRPDFNNLMKSLMGAYLSQHPEEKIDFIKGLELVKDTPSQN